MTRHRLVAFGTAVVMAVCLVGLAGCQAKKTAATTPAATVPAAGPATAPGSSDAALLAKIKPYLDCAYAAFVKAQAGQKTFRPEAAGTACAGCASLLEPFREFVYERSGDKDYVAELTGMVQDHALKVMEEASAKAR